MRLACHECGMGDILACLFGLDEGHCLQTPLQTQKQHPGKGSRPVWGGPWLGLNIGMAIAMLAGVIFAAIRMLQLLDKGRSKAHCSPRAWYQRRLLSHDI
jgi:hypothetical protein